MCDGPDHGYSPNDDREDEELTDQQAEFRDWKPTDDPDFIPCMGCGGDVRNCEGRCQV